MKICDIFSYCCSKYRYGYSLEPPQNYKADQTRTHRLYFMAKMNQYKQHLFSLTYMNVRMMELVNKGGVNKIHVLVSIINYAKIYFWHIFSIHFFQNFSRSTIFLTEDIMYLIYTDKLCTFVSQIFCLSFEGRTNR